MEVSSQSDGCRMLQSGMVLRFRPRQVLIEECRLLHQCMLQTSNEGSCRAVVAGRCVLEALAVYCLHSLTHVRRNAAFLFFSRQLSSFNVQCGLIEVDARLTSAILFDIHGRHRLPRKVIHSFPGRASKPLKRRFLEICIAGPITVSGFWRRYFGSVGELDLKILLTADQPFTDEIQNPPMISNLMLHPMNDGSSEILAI